MLRQVCPFTQRVSQVRHHCQYVNINIFDMSVKIPMGLQHVSRRVNVKNRLFDSLFNIDDA